MDQEDEYHRIVRREATERVTRMVTVLRGDAAHAWDELYRHAHTLAGIAGDLDPHVAETARRVAGRLRDPYGARRRLAPEEERDLRAEVALMEERIQRIVQRDQA